jgi:hypothetical protein
MTLSLTPIPPLIPTPRTAANDTAIELQPMTLPAMPGGAGGRVRDWQVTS